MPNKGADLIEDYLCCDEKHANLAMFGKFRKQKLVQGERGNFNLLSRDHFAFIKLLAHHGIPLARNNLK